MTTRFFALFTLRILPILPALPALMFAAGCAGSPSRSDRIEADAVDTTAKSEWLGVLPANLGKGLCADDELFRACYPVSETECQQRAEMSAAGCAGQFQASIPEQLDDRAVTRWGGEIGQCAGQALQESLDASYPFNESERCREALDAT